MSLAPNHSGQPPELSDPRSRPETMRALCRLVGGLAHEYNNYLNVVNSNASELMAERELRLERRRNAQLIAVAGERAAQLTRQLLIFSGQRPPVLKPVELNSLLTDFRPAIERLAGPHYEIEIKLAAVELGVAGDREMLEQVVAVMVANAVDAAKLDRAFVLTTKVVELTAADVAQHPARQEGSFVQLSCQDAGEGIPPSALPHIFEPFFTTRAAKARLGLGLSVAYGIVESHHGWIEVDSQLDRGSQFCIYLPKVAAPVAVAAAVTPGQPREIIMLVEDDELLRETTVAVLKQAGYRVLQAESAETARETWQWHADRITLLLTDVVLPKGASGLELAAEFHAENPALKVICTSGFSHEIMSRLGDLPAGFCYLPKPCLPPKMLKVVRALLDGVTP